ncbi:hypothetical protein RSOLAG22IIIB_04675 [Rhizoctonia solani]|uniref:Uncharacterized protein n=1 Tax=Rhizoctonia solani TaxID=456999 RepID=A0A0K6FZ55_9AGAM|nr:hypothetical protein RSOLAG22IIIB_04675 [Rhizoctonia solani]
MDNLLNKIASDRHVQAARDAVANLPPPVKKAAKAGMIGVGTTIAVFATPPLLGFTASGVAAGSLAAAVQSAVYGAAVPAGSLFAIMQSVGATATIVPALIAGVSASGIAGAAAASQEQDSDANREDGEGGSCGKEADEQDKNGQQAQDKNEKQNFTREKVEIRIQRVLSRELGRTRIQVASPEEDQVSIGDTQDTRHDGTIFRPMNNER